MGAMKPRYDVNPFMEGFTKYVQPKKANKKVLTGDTYENTITGDVFSSVVIEKSDRYEDVGDFIKLKTTAYAVATLDNLSAASHRLLFWMMNKLEFNRDYVTIYGPKAQTELGYKSINSIYKAIDGLLEANIIAMKEGGTWMFFINPNILYKGNMLYLFFAYKEELEKAKKLKHYKGIDEKIATIPRRPKKDTAVVVEKSKEYKEFIAPLKEPKRESIYNKPEKVEDF